MTKPLTRWVGTFGLGALTGAGALGAVLLLEKGNEPGADAASAPLPPAPAGICESSAAQAPDTLPGSEPIPARNAELANMARQLEEIRELLDQRTPVTDPAESADAATQSGEAEQEEAAPELLSNARAVVEDAVERGQWTEADAQELRAHLPELGPGAHDELFSSLFVAINNGELAPDDGVWPF